jgi:hypothetical protein
MIKRDNDDEMSDLSIPNTGLFSPSLITLIQSLWESMKRLVESFVSPMFI